MAPPTYFRWRDLPFELRAMIYELIYPYPNFLTPTAMMLNPTNSQPTLTYSFLNLPPELRLMIYEHLLPHDEILYSYKGGFDHMTAENARMFRAPVPGLNFLFTCRTIYLEGMSVLHANNEFAAMPLATVARIQQQILDRDNQRRQAREEAMRQFHERLEQLFGESLSVRDAENLAPFVENSDNEDESDHWKDTDESITDGE